jgi:two-component system sensor histidine kinase/response regulator
MFEVVKNALAVKVAADAPELSAQDDCARRSDELFEQQQQEIYRNTDQLFARLMIVQWIAAVAMALLISPYTWIGQSSAIHIHVWAAIFLGGAISFFPIWLTRAWPGAAITRYVIAVGQMLMSALLISVTGGRIETHFHVFGSLVILSFYRDWRVLIPATIVVALDHFLRGVYWPYSVYGVLTASPWRSIEHAAWVIFEDLFLVISCLRSIREMRSIANRTAALEASEQGFRQIFEEGPMGIAVVDLDQRFVKVNSSACQMMGYSAQELLQRNTLELTHPDDVSNDQNVAKSLREGASRCSFDKRYLRKDKELLWVTLTASMIRDKNGAPLHYLTMMKDISERKRVEQALHAAKEEADRANHAKSEFLSRMSHELRTPLNAILGFGQLLERQNPNPNQRSRIQHVINAGRHLLALINEVLDISRIEAGRMQLSLEPVCVAEAVQETLGLMRPLANERRVQLIADVDMDATVHVLADRQRFKQVLLNLLTNAVKYTPSSGSVTVSYAANGNEKLRIQVRDDGPGIAKEKLARLFTPFDRLGAELSNVEGTGLGLVLSQRLIHAMGGAIGVESAHGQGSTFWVELPRTKSPLEQTRSVKTTNTKRQRRADTEKRRLLYIEDNLSNLTLIEEILEERPEIELLSAMQGQVGLDLARQHSPDLILLDLHLPDLPGWEVLSQLKTGETTSDIPVVVVSADATTSQIKRLMKAGALSYLTKPLDVTEFFRVLDDTLVTNDTKASLPNSNGELTKARS